MSTHAYPVSSTASGSVDEPLLMSEVTAVVRAPTQMRVQTRAKRHEVVFEYAVGLDIGEELSLAAVVTAHAGTTPVPLPKAKITRYISARSQVVNYQAVDYKTGLTQRLHPKRIMSGLVKGEVIRLEFYVSKSVVGGVTTYTDLVVAEDVAYTRDAGGIATQQLKTISWYADDGTDTTVCSSKVWGPKMYDPTEGLAEGKRRRTNHDDEMAITVLGMIMATEGIDSNAAQVLGVAFLFEPAIEAGRSLYIGTGDTGALVTAINAIDTGVSHTWLVNIIDAGPPAVAIKDYLLAELA